MGGFFLTLLLNMALRFEWGLAALGFYVLHLTLGLPLFLVPLLLAVWVVHSLVITLLVSWGGKCAAVPTPKRENKNPYSAKNQDILPKDTSK